MAALTSAGVRLKPISLGGSIQIAHRPFGAEQLRLADAVQALDLVHHVARAVIAERHLVELAVARGQDGEQQEVRARLSTRKPCCVTACGRRGWRDRGGFAHPPAPFPGWCRAGSQRDRGAAVAWLTDSIYSRPGEPLISSSIRLTHAFVQRLRRSARVGGVDYDRRRRDRRVLRHRQLRDGHAGQHRMNSATTQANTGRSMKNCGHGGSLQAPEAARGADAAAAPEAAGAATAAAAVPLAPRAPRHGLHRVAAAQLLEAIDHHLFTGLQPVQHHPLAFLHRTDLHLPRRHLAVGTDHRYGVALSGRASPPVAAP